MGAGALVVMIFSDPVVKCFDSLGNLLNIDGFYIAFFLAPIASNAKIMTARIMASIRVKWGYSAQAKPFTGSVAHS